MRLLKALSLLAALALLGGAVLNAQVLGGVLGAAPDAGKAGPGPLTASDNGEKPYLHATKAGPLIRPRPEPQPQAQQAAPAPSRDGGP